MAKFLNTSATTHYLEELITRAQEKLIIISPFLQFNRRIKDLIEDKDRMKIDIHLVYGKSELAPQEINWLDSLKSLRIHFCRDLHAKCYMNEQTAIVTSMNLYEFSQVNNHEMGVYFTKDEDFDLYRDALAEAQRLIRFSEEFRLSAEKVSASEDAGLETPLGGHDKLTTAKLAKLLGMSTVELTDSLVSRGFLDRQGDQLKLTAAGSDAGAESRTARFGTYFLWPKGIHSEQPKPSTALPSKGGIAPKVVVSRGKCIRCAKQIAFNPHNPLCLDCFNVWNRYQDPNYVERYCHRCGQESETSFARPLCRSCYAKAD